MPNPNLPIGGQYNVYQGARYVPVIDGAWSSTKAYEPLVIVTYEGNSYTSRTFVPAGVEPTNETYWAVTGNYNAQVEQYRQEVEALQNRISQLPVLKEHPNILFISGKWASLDVGGETWISLTIKNLGLGTENYYSFISEEYGLLANNPVNTYDYLINQVNDFDPDYIFICGYDTYNYGDGGNAFTNALYNLAVDINDKWPKALAYFLGVQNLPGPGNYKNLYWLAGWTYAQFWNGLSTTAPVKFTAIGLNKLYSVIAGILNGYVNFQQAFVDQTSNVTFSLKTNGVSTEISIQCPNFNLTTSNQLLMTFSVTPTQTHRYIAFATSGEEIIKVTLLITPNGLMISGNKAATISEINRF